MATNVSIVEAVDRWVDGDPTLRDSYLWGMKVMWWGRLGKLAAFLGGLVTVLDIIGPQRLKEASDRYVKRFSKPKDPMVIAVVLVIFGVGLFVSVGISASPRFVPGQDLTELFYIAFDETLRPHVIIGLLAFVLIASTVVDAKRFMLSKLAGLLESGRAGNILRGLSLALFSLGFFFDFLAS
jgi:hypothetical protein